LHFKFETAHADGPGAEGGARGRGGLHALGTHRGLGRGDKEREAVLEIRSLNNGMGSRDRKGSVADLGFKWLSVERVEKTFVPRQSTPYACRSP
jgi:hypothetical protein